MTYKINLVMGDYSGDGNGRTKKYEIESSLSAKEIQAAYKKATKIIGIDLVEDICNHGEAVIKKNQLDKFVAQGADFPDIFGYDQKDIDEKITNQERFYMDQEGFLNLYLFMIKLGDPGFTYEFAINDSEDVAIGGDSFFC